MILGILSDTHGERQRTANAVRVLREAGAEVFVHCGDVGGPEVLDELAGLRVWLVLGNTDCSDRALIRYAEELGLSVTREAPARIKLDGRSILAFHGHERQFARLVEETLARGVLPEEYAGCDYVLHGHTHIACDAHIGPARIINPGALHRAPNHTVATLDPKANQVRFWHVSDDVADSSVRSRS